MVGRLIRFLLGCQKAYFQVRIVNFRERIPKNWCGFGAWTPTTNTRKSCMKSDVLLKIMSPLRLTISMEKTWKTQKNRPNSALPILNREKGWLQKDSSNLGVTWVSDCQTTGARGPRNCCLHLTLQKQNTPWKIKGWNLKKWRSDF